MYKKNKGGVCNIDSLKWVLNSSSVGCQIEEVNELVYPRFNIPLLIELFR